VPSSPRLQALDGVCGQAADEDVGHGMAPERGGCSNASTLLSGQETPADPRRFLVDTPARPCAERPKVVAGEESTFACRMETVIVRCTARASRMAMSRAK
jgi:hypothetical protein